MSQSLSKIFIHLVFSTKHREPLITSNVRATLHSYLATVLKNLESPAIKIGGTADHVHILLRLSRNHALAKVVEEIKTASSRWLKTQGKALANFHWQSGYGAFSVGAGEVEAVTEYISEQEAHHMASTFQDELRNLLKSHGIEFDERYLWD